MLDLILHLDAHLLALLEQYGLWIYGILFAIIFAETGLVIIPFLPGDSLLFVTGALCGMQRLSLAGLIPLLILAAVSGDNLNYWLGRHFGVHLFKPDSRWFKQSYLHKTEAFYQLHGGKTVIFARFLPIVRTFAPFVAGISQMRYGLFFSFSVLGSIAWIGSLTLGGYFFGNIPWVKNNLTLAILGVIVLSFMPAVRELIRHKLKNKHA